MALQIPELPSLPSNLFDLLRGIATTFAVKLKHERAMSLTEPGKRSVELRMVAQEALNSLPVEQTHAMFRQAADLHPAEDVGRAAAAARFDLARSFERQQTGSRLENHLHAAQIYRQVLLCPERDEDPLRAALTRDALAVCLRKIAEHPGQSEHRPELMSEAIRYSQESIRLALGAGPLGLMQAAFYLNGLGNHLRKNDSEFDDAMVCLQRAEECLNQALGIEAKLMAALNGPTRQMLSERDFHTIGGFMFQLRQERQNDSIYGVLYNISGAYLQRGRSGDHQRAEKLLLGIIKGGSVTKTVPAQCLLATVYLDQDKRTEAINLLQQVSAEKVELDQAENVVRLFDRAGLLDESLRLAHHYISKYHQMRMDTRADHLADEMASHAHRLGALASRIYAKKGDSVSAFLSLETTSGAHFEEQIGQFVRPQAKLAVARGLLEIGSVFRTASVMADELASRFEQVRANDAATAQEGLRTILESYKTDASAYEHVYYPNELADRYAKQTFVDLIEKALAAPDPVTSLREDSETMLARLVQFGSKASALDPNLTGRFDFPLLSKAELAALLKRYPDTCFIRLSLESDLQVVSVWHEKGRISGTSRRVTLPRRLFSLLREIRDDPKAGTPELLRKEIERIDLSAAFLPAKRAVLLPSRLASVLPLAALGPRGKTLLDRYKCLLWLPSLAPLRLRQAPLPPRHGTLTIAPLCATPLLLKEWALSGVLPMERRLFDAEATLRRVKEESRTADIVTFYTHGRHEPMNIEVELFDRPLRAEDAWLFRGAERVELWACQTGVNLATDWLDHSGLDQHFGLDIAMIEAGARSAIGALWAVPELVTACVVRRYRLALCAGEDGATALCTAQRAFRDELLPQILTVFDRGDDAIWESVEKYFAKLSLAEKDGASSASPRSLPEVERARLRESLVSPTAWAGFRFVGVPEQRPTAAWDPETIRPLTKFEFIEVDELAKELLSIPPPDMMDRDAGQEKSDDDDDADFWLEQESLIRDAWAASSQLTPEHALKAARLYHDRLHSARHHNLLLGLAWLYEALLLPSLLPADRALLRLEAAHFWLELAESEHPVGLWLPPVSGLLARAGELLNDELPLERSILGNRLLSYQLSRASAQARYSFLIAIRSNDVVRNGLSLETVTSQAVSAARPFLDVLLTQTVEPEYAIQRALSIACSILLADSTLHRKALAQLEHQLRNALPRTAESGLWVNAERLVAWQRMVISELEPKRPLRIKRHWELLPRERCLIATAEMQELGQHGAVAGDQMKHVISWHLSALEAASWGTPSARLQPFLQSTGNPGDAYRVLLGAFLHRPAEGPAVHHIACMQQACDMRIALLHRLVRAAPLAARVFSVDLQELANLVLYRERLVVAWADSVNGSFASMAEQPASSSAGRGNSQLADPFTQNPASLVKSGATANDLSAWVLFSLVTSPPSTGRPQGQTVAFMSAAQVAFLGREIEGRWLDILRRSDERAKDLPAEMRAQADLAALLDPGVEISGCESWVRELPDGNAVLGLMFSSAMTVVGSVSWRTRSAHGEHSATLEPALEVRALLVQMFQQVDDVADRRGFAGQRAMHWVRIVDALAPFLQRLLGPALNTKEPLNLYVLAPGSLRALPFSGLRAGDLPLLTAFRSITYLPALKFADPIVPASPAKKTACLFAASESSKGMLEFGRASIKTLRKAFPVYAVEPRRPEDLRGSDIVENDAVQAIASDLACLRFYGQGSVMSGAASDSHLLLSHGRVLSCRNIMDPLPVCEVVELWAATAGIAPYVYAASDREDRLPGLVPAFLQCGANGVIDLAWPVLDLVKALVCERYGLIRWRLRLHASQALTQAVTWTQRLLADWAAARNGYIGTIGALLWLDQARRAGVIALGEDPACVEPYATLAEHPLLRSLSVDELIAEAQQSSHLAAFRYWGGIDRGLEHGGDESGE